MGYIPKPLNQKDFSFKIIKDLGMIYVSENSKTKDRVAIFECSICNKHIKKIVATAKYKSKSKCKECANKTRKRKHGDSNTELYKIWGSMRQRCSNPSIVGYENYGGRGISIDPVWNVFIIFRDWALASGYSKELSIDRIDNDGNYEPSNCRWSNRTVQSRNTRKLKTTNTSGYRGVYFNKKRGKWMARIGLSSKLRYLGYFDYPWTGAYAYDSYVISNNLEHTRNF